MREFGAKNPERKREIDRKSGAKYRAAHPELHIERGRLYREANPEKRRATCQRWDKANPKKKLAQRHARLAREHGAEGRHTAEDVDRIASVQDHRCNMCACDLREVGQHIDHIIPLSRGGSNWPYNLQLLCGTCNRRNGAKLPSELIEV